MKGPQDLDAPETNTWGRWGDDDEIGALNFLTPELAVDAARLVQSGKIFTLGLNVFDQRGDPASPGRPPALRVAYRDWSHYESGKVAAADGVLRSVDDGFFISSHGTTHLDALGHVFVDEQLYNGFPARTTAGGMARCSVAAAAEHGIFTRAVLLDIAHARGVECLERDAEIAVGELEDITASAGIQIRRGDVLLLRTGSLARFYRDGPENYFAPYSEPGLSDDPDLVAWIDSHEISGLGTDTLANELPRSLRSGDDYPLHRLLMRNRGISFHEALWLEDLAADCRKDGHIEGLYVALPLKLQGTSGSPMNPIFVK